MRIKVYKFNTTEEANSTMDFLNQVFNLPSPNGTSYYSEMSYEKIGDFYYLYWDELFTQFLGEPIEITI
jgi:hypothetical protein